MIEKSPIGDLTDGAVVAELGRRITDHRIALALTQQQFADAAGVGRSTVQRIERGDSIQLLSLVKLLRTLGRADALDALLPAGMHSPLVEFERTHRRPQRVRRRAEEPPGSWAWGHSDDGGEQQ